MIKKIIYLFFVIWFMFILNTANAAYQIQVRDIYNFTSGGGILADFAHLEILYVTTTIQIGENLIFDDGTTQSTAATNNIINYTFIDENGISKTISPADYSSTMTFETGEKLLLTVNESTNTWKLDVDVLDDEDSIIGNTRISLVGENIYGFQTTFSSEVRIWNVYFPSGKTLDPAGTFICTIDGWPFYDYASIRSDFNILKGLQFSLSEDWVWTVGTDGRGLFQLMDYTSTNYTLVTSVIDDVAVPSTMPLYTQGSVVTY